jgi:hypothetical protein
LFVQFQPAFVNSTGNNSFFSSFHSSNEKIHGETQSEFQASKIENSVWINKHFVSDNAIILSATAFILLCISIIVKRERLASFLYSISFLYTQTQRGPPFMN